MLNPGLLSSDRRRLIERLLQTDLAEPRQPGYFPQHHRRNEDNDFSASAPQRALDSPLPKQRLSIKGVMHERVVSANVHLLARKASLDLPDSLLLAARAC